MAGKSWTSKEEATLIVLYNAGEPISVISEKLRCSEGSVTSRVCRLRDRGAPIGFRHHRKPGPEPRYVGIDQADLDWMAYYRQRAARRRAAIGD